MAKLKRSQKRNLILVSLAVYAFIIGMMFRGVYKNWTSTSTETISAVPPIIKTETPAKKGVVEEPLPPQKVLEVPFTPQAPLANWDALHEEACEEASLMMVKYARSNQLFGTPSQVDDEIQQLVGWESNHGYEVDVTVSELSKIAEQYYGLSTGRVIDNLTVTKIKKEIAAGRPVVIPASGQNLPNPYFTAPGPVYHMLVIKGYTDNEFITNDPGTKRGKDFRYSYDGLLGAVHDWDSKNILAGAKRALVFD